MNVSSEDARRSLGEAEAVAERTRKSIAASHTGGLLMMWGVICTAGYLGTYYFLEWVWHIWFVLSGAGCIVTFWVGWRQLRLANPVKVPAAERIGWRIFLFWLLLYVYMFIWLGIVRPNHGIRINAFMITAIMFAYTVTGLWFKSHHMFWLGIIVTGITLTGFYLIPWSYYCFWMAAMVGGAFLAMGLYIQLRWRWCDAAHHK